MYNEQSLNESDLERIVFLFPEVMKLLFQDIEKSDICDITIPQRKIMHTLYFQKEPSMSEISTAIGVEMSTATVHIDQLVTLGLVERLRSETDRRVVKVKLTEYGEKKCNDIICTLRQNIGEVISKLSPANQNALRSAFEQLYSILQEGKNK